VDDKRKTKKQLLDELRELRQCSNPSLYHPLADAIAQLVWTAGPDGAVDYVNLRRNQFFRSTKEPEGTWQWTSRLHPDDAESSLKAWSVSLQTGRSYRAVHRLHCADGSYRWFLTLAAPAHDEQGRMIKWYGTATDVDDLKKEADELPRGTARYAGTLQIFPSLTFESDPQGNIILASEQWSRYTGMTAEQTAGTGWTRALHPDDRDTLRAGWSEAVRKATIYTGNHRLRAKDGSYRWFVVCSQPVRDAQGTIVRWIGALTDIDDQLKTEKALRESREELLRIKEALQRTIHDRTDELKQHNSELSNLTKKTIEALENERKSLSKELHDSIAGTLAAVKHRLEGRIEKMGRPPSGIDISLERLNEYLLGAIREIRRISKQLRPYLLDDVGLVAALNEFIKEFKELHSKMNVVHECSVSEEAITDEVKTVLYRVAQEALNNAGKHSGARTVAIRLYQQPETVCLQVKDDGCGFSPDITIPNAKSMRYGIRGMKERVEICHGWINIESEPGRGTVVTASIPLG